MRSPLLSTLLICLISSGHTFTQSRWGKAAPFPEPDEELYGIEASGKMFVIGGFGGGRAAGLAYEYDPGTDKWAKKAPMGRPAHHAALAEVSGKIYVFGGFVQPAGGPAGGWQPIDNAWEFDPVGNVWKTLPPIPRHGVAGAVVGNRLHLVSGMVTSAAVGAGQDPAVHLHTSSHDVLDLP